MMMYSRIMDLRSMSSLQLMDNYSRDLIEFARRPKIFELLVSKIYFTL